MSTRESTAVHLSSRADVEAFIERLPVMRNESIVISVNEASDALATAAEYYRLLNAAKPVNVQLAIATDDGLRRELARMLGWVVVTPSSSSGSRGDTEDFPTYVGGGAEIDEAPIEEPDDNTTTDLATYRPKYGRIPSAPKQGSPRGLTGTVIIDPSVSEKLSARNVAASPRVPRTDRRGRAPHGSGEWNIADKPPRRTRQRLFVLAAVGAAAIVVAVVAGILAYLLPTATVTLVPVENTISSDLTYGVAVPGTSYDIEVTPVSVNHTSTFDKQIPTTGARYEPDGTASGTVLFTNATLQDVTIPAGTALQGANGVSYYTQQSVGIPAADPFGSLSFGSGSVGIAAATAGEDGNADAGSITGQLAAGIYFKNQGAITGGTVKKIAVVSQADIDALTQAATADLKDRAPKEFSQALDPALSMVPDSQKATDPTFTYSLKAGQDGEAVSIHASETITAEQYDPTKLNQLAKDEAARLLAAKAGPDEIILGDTVTIGDPVALPGGLSFSRHATARTRAVISDEEQKAIEKQLAGKSMSDAEAIISGMKDVKSHNAEIKPSWLPRRMPEVLSHIKIVVQSGDATADAQP
ncbi:MAG TPA: hypothetical protein VF201_06900 [Nitrolancea sp.]